MFTGIIEEIGYVKSFEYRPNGANLEIRCEKILSDVQIGDSISVNGVCQTVTKFGSNMISVEVSDETLGVTTFKSLKRGDRVNLERALTLSSRLGGHIVSGHVDCVGELINIEKLSDFYNLSFEIPKNNAKYVIYKGSITVNGVSLTVSDIRDNIFKIAVIPHTYDNTNLRELKMGDSVNIETDILAKYIEKMLSVKDNEKNNTISIEFLKENGFV